MCLGQPLLQQLEASRSSPSGLCLLLRQLLYLQPLPLCELLSELLDHQALLLRTATNEHLSNSSPPTRIRHLLRLLAIEHPLRGSDGAVPQLRQFLLCCCHLLLLPCEVCFQFDDCCRLRRALLLVMPLLLAHLV